MFDWTLFNNLLNPVSLLFFLGIGIGMVRSNFSVPPNLSLYLSLYLIVAIGLKGGSSFAQSTLNAQVFMTLAMGIFMSVVWPFIAFWILGATTNVSLKDRAAVSTHYGSVSIITFITATTFLDGNHVAYQTSLIAVLALMEAPAIFSGLYLALKENRQKRWFSLDASLLKEIFSSGPIVLLFGTFLIGFLVGPQGLSKIKPFYSDLFEGFLSIFLLDMGLCVAAKFHDMKKITRGLLLFGLYMPVLGAVCGIGMSWAIGLDQGTAFLFGILCASASYIAVPASLKIALPDANPAIYMPLSLGITFPFNIIIGIPLYFWLTRLIYA